MTDRRIGSARLPPAPPPGPVSETQRTGITSQHSNVVGHSTTDRQGPNGRADGAQRFATIHQLAARAGITPQGLDTLAASRLRELEQISAAAFDSAIAAAPAMPRGADVGRRTATASAEQVKAIVAAFAERHGHERLESLLREGGIVKVFQSAYRDTFGVEPVMASLPELVSSFAEHLALYAERPLKLTVASSDKPPTPALRRFFSALLGELEVRGQAKQAAVLGGFNASGASAALYAAAERHSDIRRLGATPSAADANDGAQGGSRAIASLPSGGDTPLFWELAAGSVLICSDLDVRGRAHLEHHLREGGTAVVLDAAIDEDLSHSPGLMHLPLTENSPESAARAAAEFFIAARRDEQPTETNWLHLGDTTRNIIDIESLEVQLTAQARVRQLLDFAWGQLGKAPRLREHLESLATDIASRTLGVDPRRENAAWVREVRGAFASASPELQGCVSSGLLDVVLSRWFAPVNRQEAPAYFARHRGTLPKMVDDLQVSGKHSYDVSRYIQFRLDPLTRMVLGTPNVAVDVFHGSTEELTAYYETQGYTSMHAARRVHGMEFNVLRNADGMRLVVRGVENEQRLVQLGAFLKSSGVDRTQVEVLGELARVQEIDRQLLDLELASLGRPIAGVFAPASAASLEAIAAQLGVPMSALEVQSHVAGKFRFKSVQVLPAGSTTWSNLLLFEPVLGDSIADIIESTGKFGARNFSIQGDGVSFVRGDTPGAIHAVDGVNSSEGRKSWSAIANLTVLAPRGSTKHVNQASYSPLQQTPAFIDAAIKGGAGNSEQEYEHVYDAMKRLAGRTRGEVTLQAAVIIHDVLGGSAIETGRRGAAEARAEHSIARDFVDALGLAGIRCHGEEVVTGRAVQPGLALKTAAPVDLATVSTHVPDLSTIGDSQAIGSVAQFKGQKAALLIDAGAATEAGRAELRSLLRGLDPQTSWVVLDVADPNHGGVNDLARELGFETIVLGTSDDLLAQRLHSSPNFFLKHAARGEVAATKAEFLRNGSADADLNRARNYAVAVEKGLTLTARMVDGSETHETGRAVDLAAAVSELRSSAVRRIEDAIAWRRARLGLAPAKFYRTDAELDAFMAGRRPNIWIGFSKLSSADLSPRQREEAERLVEIEALISDPREVVDVTGVTAYGWEKNLQEIKARPDRRFDLLGAVTESTAVDAIDLMKAFDSMPADWQASLLASTIDDKIRDYLVPLAKSGGDADAQQVALLNRALMTTDDKKKSTERRLAALDVPGLATVFGEIFAGRTAWEPSDHIAHLLPVAVSWVGQSRQLLLRVARRFGGHVINAGGGKIAEETIRMQFTLGIRTHLWADMEMSESAKAQGKSSAGASCEMAKQYPAHAFATVEDYFRRRGLFGRYEKLAAFARAKGIDIGTLDGARQLTAIARETRAADR